MKPIRTGIIGFGKMAENHHLKQMRACGLYDVAGVCDITPSRRAAAEAQGLKATGDLDAFLAWDTELVLVTTHTSAHYDAVLKVAAARKHMLIEKPMAVTGPQAEEMVAAAKKNGVVLTVYHNRHFDEDYRLVKAAVREGQIGDIVSIENRTMGPRPAVGFGVKDYNQEWRITASAGGGTLLDFGPHWCEQILDLMEGRKVVQVFADIRNIKWGDADDLFDITMVFDNGVRGRAAKADISYFNPGYKWLILGVNATLHSGGVRAAEVTIHGPESETKWEKPVEAVSLHVNLAEHLREGRPLIITAEHALRVMRVIEAARQSARAGKSVDVDI